MSFKCFAGKDIRVICKSCKHTQKFKKGDHVVLEACENCTSKGWIIQTDIPPINTLSNEAYFYLTEIPDEWEAV